MHGIPAERSTAVTAYERDVRAPGFHATGEGNSIEVPPMRAKIHPGGELELPIGVTLDETIRLLWEDHAKNTSAAWEQRFFGVMALLEGRLLAEKLGEPRS